jgi:uncharacterized protein YbjT (DUF2867 family)
MTELSTPRYSDGMTRKLSSSKVLVLGGSGFVGRHVCERLSWQGYTVTVPTRRLPARSVQMLPGVHVVQADVHDPQQLQSLVHGQDAVINLVAILHGQEKDFDQVHVQLPRQLARACHLENVHRLVHVSALGADVHGPSMYQRSKARGEAVLNAAAEREGLAVTLLRPSVIFGKDDQFINLFAKLQALFPVMPLAGADTRFQPVWVQDVAQAIVHAINHHDTAGQVYELCGPDILSMRELVQVAGRWSGHARPVVALPHAIGWWQALLMEWAPGPTLMSRDNLASMQVHNVGSGHLPGLRALGVSEPTRLQRIFPPLR